MSFPTQLTVLRILLVPVFYVLFAVVEPAEVFWAGFVFLIAALSDWYDGYVARRYNSVTALGAFLDPLADKLLTSTALVAFAASGLIPMWMVIIVVARDIYLTVFRIIADSMRKPVKTTATAKVKTFLQMSFIGYVLIALIMQDGMIGEGAAAVANTLLDLDALYVLISMLSLITVWTAVQYTYDNWSVWVSVTRRYILRRSPQKL
jgi:CDP-diacylglycerol---glycerol-3-phosphate 3-phosphatidyltransferase